MQAPWRLLAQQRAPTQCCAQGSAEPGSGPEKLLRGVNRMAQKAWHLGLRLLLEEPVSPPTMWTGGSTPGLLHALQGTERPLGVSPPMHVPTCVHTRSCTLTHTVPQVHTHAPHRGLVSGPHRTRRRTHGSPGGGVKEPSLGGAAR